ncbi:MAG TPA: carboxypeptidase-like regulatory domain-containing protein, partial [Vicinamibacterales bacterium]|nr:carboxypeptidase-like regulatory domain-containing protein [Vicinamibacterales bacterium]
MRIFVARLIVLAGVLLLPASAFAQASIAGTTKDASGAVLPGVTVEASSPVLIEKVRTTVSDDRGLYRIVNLPPGTYVVTFTLQGFNIVKRDGVELTGS